MKQTESGSQQPQNAVQTVYILIRWGQLYGVYADLDDAQQQQRCFIAKGNVCDLVVQQVKPKTTIK